ncbi:hypothetical protein DPMN_152653, partial [Dreissena polymorpha]
IIGPLKSRVDTICSSLPYARKGLLVTKAKFPAALRHAMDQATPASVQNAFAAFALSGLYPVNRGAINTSQLAAPGINGEEKGINTKSAERPSFDFKTDC